jgi:hypothetical protein
LHSVGLAKEAGFSRPRTAAAKNVQVSAVLFPIQTDTDILGQQLIRRRVLVLIFLVDSTCVAPFCRTVFLTPAVILSCGKINANPHPVSKQKKKDSFYAVLTHRYVKRVVHCYG